MTANQAVVDAYLGEADVVSEIQNLSVHYDGISAVTKVSLDVGEQEAVGSIGA